MPLVDVTYPVQTPDEVLQALSDALPELVSIAVACAEEPYRPPLGPGDVEIRFRRLGPFDVSGLDVVVEVRSKWFASRAHDSQQRCHRLRDELTARLPGLQFGVYLSQPVAAWAQS